MKELFPGYYRPTPEEFDDLWKTATFVFDTNVLLHIHRRNKKTRRAILDKFKRLGDRLWIPYEIAAEYQRNKLKVASNLVDSLKDILDGLKKAKEPLRAHHLREHAFLDAETLTQGIDQLIKQVEQARDNSRRVSLDDAESMELASLLHGRLDEPYSEEVRSNKLKEAKVRAEKKVPPGFKDYESKKNEGLAAGDALIWFKMLGRATEKQCPIIFVTDDAKEDWWGDEEQAYGPHPELRQEMWSVARQRFYMYKLSEFLVHAGKYLGENVPAEVVEDVKEHELRVRYTMISLDVQRLRSDRDRLAALLSQVDARIAEDPHSPHGLEDRHRLYDLQEHIQELDDVLEHTMREFDEVRSNLGYPVQPR
ncbi:PIN-like domain-containing protein [Hyalangium sp.]|uniref:PIN-like domain-containing protein n=1 Tax=Hyalangium sp. TaxID=2028555 RepID=UPI002D724425|nr:PIN-like domain-containing protein [Hyalangium sp.]HYH98763.1 PIN-like domain-containing protein [Hyalangium sp.]